MGCDNHILSIFNMFFLTVGEEMQDKGRPYLESNWTITVSTLKSVHVFNMQLSEIKM